MTIVKSNSTLRRSTLMPTLTEHHLLGSNERKSYIVRIENKTKPLLNKIEEQMGQEMGD